MTGLATRALRLVRKPPLYILRRLATESRAELDRFLQPRRARLFDVGALLARTGDKSLDALWERLGTQPWPIAASPISGAVLDSIAHGAVEQILQRAERACRHEVDLLGSGLTMLGESISWETDFKTGDRWRRGYFRDIKIVDRNRPSDVKVPWELSRLQWLLPLGQAYLLGKDERYAVSARRVFEQWIAQNPVGVNVNWAIAMEPALRILSWTWLFRVFAGTRAWNDPEFRGKFLCCLYQHGDFVSRYIERADLNGNHFTADCAGLMAAGAFFGGATGRGWLESAWHDLRSEIVVQILDDGVDFEASAAYHRLVGELFLLGGMFAEHSGLVVPPVYRERLAAAARFTTAYTKPDGSAPLWGDADDARALPLGVATIGDHRHFVASVAAWLDDAQLRGAVDGGWDEVLWLLGAERTSKAVPSGSSGALAFPAGGAYVLRCEESHVFIDCGDVGMQGRGGHGHNDILSFEAVLGGVAVISDAGCFVYTASFEERNRFRATAAHNTPQVDDQEVNRFVSPDLLWLLHSDAHPQGARVREEPLMLVFEGGHDGYRRLPEPVDVRRTIALRRDRLVLEITDRFDGAGSHRLRVPLQLAPGWLLPRLDGNTAECVHERGHKLRIRWISQSSWQARATSGAVAPTYGVLDSAPRLEWDITARVHDLSLQVVLEFMPRGSLS